MYHYVPGGGALSTSTYGEVSPISLGENVAKPKVIFLGPNKIETMFMIFFIPNIAYLIFLGSIEAILTAVFIVSGYFMFMYRFLSIK